MTAEFEVNSGDLTSKDRYFELDSTILTVKLTEEIIYLEPQKLRQVRFSPQVYGYPQNALLKT